MDSPARSGRRIAVQLLLALGLALVAQAAAAQAPLSLEGAWRFRAGDDPAWSSPSLDDVGWNSVDVPGPWEAGGARYDGYGWYRRQVSLPDDLRGPVGLRLAGVGNAVEVFWNGVLVGQRGSFPPEMEEVSTPLLFLVPKEAIRAGEGTHLVAVRVYNGHGPGGLLGEVEVGRYDVLARRGARGELLIGGLIAFFVAAGVYHLAFFFRRSKARDSLYFAVLCACAAVYGATFSPSVADLLAGLVSPARLRVLALVAAGPAYVGLLTGVFDLPTGRHRRRVAVAASVVLAIVAVIPHSLVTALRPAISLVVAAGLLGGFAHVLAVPTVPGSYRRILTAGLAALVAAMLWDLMGSHGLVSTVYLVDRVPGLFWFGFMAFVIAMGMATAGAFADAEQYARTDALTGLVRRHVFVDALTREAERRRRAGGMLTLLIIDLDHFKEVNDGYGHRVGDEVLARVGHLLRHNARNIDLTSRLGGEEFGVLLSDTDAEGALSFIERFRQRLAETEVPVGDGAVSGLTASVGIAVSTGWVDTDVLLDAADDAMYRAKKSGRNRVVTVNLPLNWPGRPSSTVAPE